MYRRRRFESIQTSSKPTCRPNEGSARLLYAREWHNFRVGRDTPQRFHMKRMKKHGDAVVVHGLRGRGSNRKISAKTQKQAIALLQQPDWHDFGPTFAAEQLAKRHQIQVGKETLRGWMIKANLWKPGARRIEDVHCWRPRRSGFGELVQWDTRATWVAPAPIMPITDASTPRTAATSRPSRSRADGSA
jgi:hypothetical protein